MKKYGSPRNDKIDFFRYGVAHLLKQADKDDIVWKKLKSISRIISYIRSKIRDEIQT